MTTSHVSSGSAGIALAMLGMKSISSLTALHSIFLCEHHACLFEERQTVRGFMNQDSQKVCCILYATAWTMTCCLPALLCWRCSALITGSGGSSGGGSSSGSAAVAAMAATAAAAIPHYSCACSWMSTEVGLASPVWKLRTYGVNTARNEAYFAAKVPCGLVLITRLSSHAVCDSTPARSIWVCCSRFAVLSGG